MDTAVVTSVPTLRCQEVSPNLRTRWTEGGISFVRASASIPQSGYKDFDLSLPATSPGLTLRLDLTPWRLAGPVFRSALHSSNLWPTTFECRCTQLLRASCRRALGASLLCFTIAACWRPTYRRANRPSSCKLTSGERTAVVALSAVACQVQTP